MSRRNCLSCLFFLLLLFLFFFFNDPPTTAIYTLSLHDALPIYSAMECDGRHRCHHLAECRRGWGVGKHYRQSDGNDRSEEHTSELQLRVDLVCRLLLEKKKKKKQTQEKQQIYEKIRHNVKSHQK